MAAKKIALFIFLAITFVVIFFNYNVPKARAFSSRGGRALDTTTTKESETNLVKEVFDIIYQRYLWGEDGGGSGPGSTVIYTESVREILKSVIDEFNIESMLDAPCGSFIWMPFLLGNLSHEFKSQGKHFRYHGVDVVESVINASKARYANEADWQFSVCDFSKQPLPDGYELVFSRDALQHLSFEKIFNSLRAYSRVKNARFLLVGSYLENIGDNVNINVGSMFWINLLKPPFNLTNYVKIYHENAADSQPKSLILYDIPNYLSKIDYDLLKANLNINS